MTSSPRARRTRLFIVLATVWSPACFSLSSSAPTTPEGGPSADGGGFEESPEGGDAGDATVSDAADAEDAVIPDALYADATGVDSSSGEGGAGQDAANDASKAADVSTDDASTRLLTDATADSSAGEAGACIALSSDGGACNTIANVGAMIAAVCTNSAPPVQTGGTVVDGTYVLTALEGYPPTCTGSGPTGEYYQGTVVVSGGCVQEVQTSWIGTDGGGATTTSTYLWAFSGSQVSSTYLCGGMIQGAITYSATPTQITLGVCPSGSCAAGQSQYTVVYTAQ